MEHYKKWKYNVEWNVREYINSLEQDTTCTCILGLLVFVPFILYLIYGIGYFIIVVIPIKLYQKKYRIHQEIVVQPNTKNPVLEIVVK